MLIIMILALFILSMIRGHCIRCKLNKKSFNLERPRLLSEDMILF